MEPTLTNNTNHTSNTTVTLPIPPDEDLTSSKTVHRKQLDTIQDQGDEDWDFCTWVKDLFSILIECLCGCFYESDNLQLQKKPIRPSNPSEPINLNKPLPFRIRMEGPTVGLIGDDKKFHFREHLTLEDGSAIPLKSTDKYVPIYLPDLILVEDDDNSTSDTKQILELFKKAFGEQEDGYYALPSCLFLKNEVESEEVKSAVAVAMNEGFEKFPPYVSFQGKNYKCVDEQEKIRFRIDKQLVEITCAQGPGSGNFPFILGQFINVLPPEKRQFFEISTENITALSQDEFNEWEKHGLDDSHIRYDVTEKNGVDLKYVCDLDKPYDEIFVMAIKHDKLTGLYIKTNIKTKGKDDQISISKLSAFQNEKYNIESAQMFLKAGVLEIHIPMNLS